MRRSRIALGAGSIAAAGALVVAAGVLPAGARGHHRPDGPTTVPSTTTTTTPPPSSATYSYALTMTGLAGSSEPLTVTGTAALDLAGHRAELTATPSRSVGLLGTGTVDVIVADKALYAKVPGASLLTGGKPWISISGHGIPAATQATSLADRLAGAVGNVPAAIAWATSHPGGHPMATVTSSSTTDGSTTTTMQLTLAGMKPRAQGRALPSAIPVTVTSDARGRLSALSATFSLLGASASLSMTSTGYDAALSIAPPAPADTLSLSPSAMKAIAGLLGLAGGSGHGGDHRGHIASSLSSAASSAKGLGSRAMDWLHHLDRDAS